MLTVACLVADEINPFEFGVACEVFGDDRSDRGVPRMDFRIAGATLDPVSVQYSRNCTITPETDLAFARTADLVVVPAFMDSGTSVAPAALVDAVREASANGATILTLCTGAFIAAEAGLLQGKRATTHWKHADRLQRDYPDITVEPDALFIDEGSIVTSAGTAAGVDAALHVIRRAFGAAAAAAVARGMVVPPVRDGGQSQYATKPVPVDRADRLAPLIDSVAGRLDEEHTVASLARDAHVSERTLARRFKDELGTTPMAWLASQRLRRAQELLESTDLGIEDVANRAGFGTGALLRHHFTKALGTTPTAYRARFSCPDDATMRSA